MTSTEIAVREAHRCAWATGCVNVDVRPVDPATGRAERLGAAIVDGTVCPGCLARLETAVKYLPRDYDRLREALGESASGGGDFIHLTRDAAIPINTSTEALMVRLVDAVSRAEVMVSVALHLTGNRRKKPGPVKDSIAARVEVGRVGETDYQMVARACKLIGPCLDDLLETEPTLTLVWVPGDDGEDDSRAKVMIGGLDVARALVEINRLVGRRLGLTKLRHQMAMPCPASDRKGRYCGALTVGRDDGEARVNCTTCGASWSDREYTFLTGLVLDEIDVKEENDMLRWCLAEAYWRLDTLRNAIDGIDGDPALEQAGAAQVVIDGVLAILDHGEGHPRPEDRQAATDERDKAKAIESKKRAKAATA